MRTVCVLNNVTMSRSCIKSQCVQTGNNVPIVQKNNALEKRINGPITRTLKQHTYLYDHHVGDKESLGEMVWLLHSSLPDILLKLLLSFLCASFRPSLIHLQASFKLPAGFHLALLQASFELASNIPLSFLQAHIQLPSGLSLMSL